MNRIIDVTEVFLAVTTFEMADLIMSQLDKNAIIRGQKSVEYQVITGSRKGL